MFSRCASGVFCRRGGDSVAIKLKDDPAGMDVRHLETHILGRLSCSVDIDYFM